MNKTIRYWMEAQFARGRDRNETDAPRLIPSTFILHPLGYRTLFLHNFGVNTGMVEASVVGRTIPSWRMVVENELRKLQRFREFLRSEDKAVFDDLLNQCRLYASYASSTVSPVKEVPLIISMLFGQHKRLMELEKRIRTNDLDPR